MIISRSLPQDCQPSAGGLATSFRREGCFPTLRALRTLRSWRVHIGWSKTKIDSRIAELTSLTRLSPEILKRYPLEISGGQRQRISLMRALMLDADVLLLDEPLGALDPMVRAELQDDLSEVFKRLKRTVVLVTHDMNEAAFFADQIVLMLRGEIVQIGTAEDLLSRPSQDFVSRFVKAQERRLPAGAVE